MFGLLREERFRADLAIDTPPEKPFAPEDLPDIISGDILNQVLSRKVLNLLAPQGNRLLKLQALYSFSGTACTVVGSGSGVDVVSLELHKLDKFFSVSSSSLDSREI